MLDSGGELVEALLVAGSGIASVRRVRDKFEQERDQLAPGRQARARPFYQALDRLAGARRDLQAATVRPRSWQELEAQLHLVRDRRISLARKQVEIRGEIERLQRIKRVRPWLDQWKELHQRYAAVAGAPRLPADTQERWRQARHRVELARRQVTAVLEDLQGVAGALATEQPDEKLLKQAPQIEDAERAQNQIAADQRDLPRREAERRQTAIEIDNAVSALGHKDFDHVAVIMPRGPQIVTARDLIKGHGVLTERLENAADEAGRHEAAIAAAESEPNAIAEPADTGHLTALLAEARAEGEPRRRLSGLRAKLAQEEARLAATLAKVPLWERGLEPLVALVPPAREAIERAAAALSSAPAGLGEAEREIDRLRRDRAAAAERQNTARQGKPVPDSASIAAARSDRDLGWSLIRRSRFEGEPLEAEIAAYAAEVGLAASFEHAIRTADDLADRRDEESERLAVIAALDAAIARLDQDIEAAAGQFADARRVKGAAVQAWTAVASALGFAETTDPADVRDFVAARAGVLDVRAGRDAAQEAVAAELAQQEALRSRFLRLMPLDQPDSLSEAFAAAQLVIDRASAQRRQRDQLQTELNTMRRLHRRAEDDRETAQTALQGWRAAWDECLAQLKRPAGETPAGLERAIELIEESHRARRHLVDLDHRICGMRANISRFEGKVAAVMSSVAPELCGQPAEHAARELRRRLDDHRKIEAKRDQLVEQQQELEAKLAQAKAEHRQAECEIEGLRREIGGGSDEEIVAQIAMGAERAEVEARLQDCELELLKIGDGWTIAALEREKSAVPPETVDSDLARLELSFDNVTVEREEAASEEQRLGDQLRRIGASENAIAAEERRQSAIAAVTRISADALLYHAAACLLQAGLERLRDAGGGGLLERIGDVFVHITGGAYAGVVADEDNNGTPFLIAIENDGTTKKRIDQLSEGTRDQLFLALRFAMLEDYAAKAPTPPFIADDLLQTFDDYGRTANALAALAELSRHVQVIVLSHHRRLIEVARTLPTNMVNLCEIAA